MNKKAIAFFSAFVAVVILDQATKYWIRGHLVEDVGAIDMVPGLFQIVHAENPGAAMSILRDFPYRTALFLGFTVVAIGVVGDMFRKLPKDDRFMATTLGLVMAGAIGNAIDRALKGTVTDFLRVYTEAASIKGFLVHNFGTASWPSFNVADSALCVGVGLFLVHYLFLEEKAPAPAAVKLDKPADAPPA